jgi:nucleoside-diphosphate-sugar epimerase
MKYLITGASGFLGKRLRRELRQKHHEVFCYDITLGYNILYKDQLETTIQDWMPDTIIHLAACADLNIYRENPEASRKVNIEGTRNILKLCQKYNVRLLFASTCCCYGNNNIHPSNENSPLVPTESYAKSKKESEDEILKVGLPHCCMRLATFYGPEMRAELASAIFLDKCHNNQKIQIHGDGTQTRTITYVDDIVSGIIIIAESEPKHTIVNVTTEDIVSVLDMVRIAKEVTGNDVEVEHVEDRVGQIYREVISSKRLQEMGWKPKVSFEEGMKLSYEYYKKNNNKWN